jgi:hypothetical protein
VPEDGVLRRIFRPRRDEILEGWRGLYNEELHNVYSYQNKTRMIMSKRMRWAWYAVRM